MRARPSLVAAFACVLAGCSGDPQTCRLETRELTMWATITDLEGEVQVEVEFAGSDGETTLELCHDRDRLLVNGVEFESIRVFGEHYYRAEFGESAERYEITLERKDADSATVAVDMPPAFEITAPEPGSSHSRAANLDIAWTPIWDGNLMHVTLLEDIGSSCIDGIGVFESVEDVGAMQIPGGSLVSGAVGQECDLALLLTREIVVEHPSGTFADGAITAYLNRGMVLHSVE